MIRNSSALKYRFVLEIGGGGDLKGPFCVGSSGTAAAAEVVELGRLSNADFP